MSKQQLVWKCEKCGFEEPGTSKGSAAFLKHQKAAKQSGEEGHRVVLADAESGEVVEDNEGRPVRSLSKAQFLGFVAKKGKSGGDGGTIPSKTTKGRFTPEVIDLDTRLRFLYEWDKIVVPEMTQDIGEWIWDCVMGFHIQNRDRVKFDVLLKEAS